MVASFGGFAIKQSKKEGKRVRYKLGGERRGARSRARARAGAEAGAEAGGGARARARCSARAGARAREVKAGEIKQYVLVNWFQPWTPDHCTPPAISSTKAGL